MDWEAFRQALIASLEEANPLTIADIIKRFGFIPTERFYTYFPDLTDAVKKRYTYYKKAELEKIRHELLYILQSEEYPPPSLEEVAKRVGSKYKMNKYYPDLCSKIVEKYLHYRKAHHLELTKQIHHQIREAALKLHAEGKNPHGKSVGRLISKPGIMLNKEAQAALHKVRFELGYEKSGD